MGEWWNWPRPKPEPVMIVNLFIISEVAFGLLYLNINLFKWLEAG